MTQWFRHRGDTGDTMMPFLEGVADLSGATAVSATLTGCDGTEVPLTGSVLDPATRQVQLNLGSWITTAPLDTYDVKTHVDFGPTLRRTWPASPNRDTLIVIA